MTLVVVGVVVVAGYVGVIHLDPSAHLPGSPPSGPNSSPVAVAEDLVGRLYGSDATGLGTEQTDAADIAPADRGAFAAAWRQGVAMPMNGIDQAVYSTANSASIERVTVTQAASSSTDATDASVTMTVAIALWTVDAGAGTANPHVQAHVVLDTVEVSGRWYVSYPWQ